MDNYPQNTIRDAVEAIVASFARMGAIVCSSPQFDSSDQDISAYTDVVCNYVPVRKDPDGIQLSGVLMCKKQYPAVQEQHDYLFAFDEQPILGRFGILEILSDSREERPVTVYLLIAEFRQETQLPEATYDVYVRETFPVPEDILFPRPRESIPAGQPIKAVPAWEAFYESFTGRRGARDKCYSGREECCGLLAG